MAAKRINLALQGGGAHGAFAWGVLDRLLDEPEIEIRGISGTSAGALNGAALAAGTGGLGRGALLHLRLGRRAHLFKQPQGMRRSVGGNVPARLGRWRLWLLCRLVFAALVLAHVPMHLLPVECCCCLYFLA